MIQRGVVIMPVDLAIKGYEVNPRLPRETIREFQDMMGANHGDSEAKETWLDELEYSDMMSELDDTTLLFED
jgi:hypothetical protein